MWSPVSVVVIWPHYATISACQRIMQSSVLQDHFDNYHELKDIPTQPEILLLPHNPLPLSRIPTYSISCPPISYSAAGAIKTRRKRRTLYTNPWYGEIVEDDAPLPVNDRIDMFQVMLTSRWAFLPTLTHQKTFKMSPLKRRNLLLDEDMPLFRFGTLPGQLGARATDFNEVENPEIRVEVTRRVTGNDILVLHLPRPHSRSPSPGIRWSKFEAKVAKAPTSSQSSATVSFAPSERHSPPQERISSSPSIIYIDFDDEIQLGSTSKASAVSVTLPEDNGMDLDHPDDIAPPNSKPSVDASGSCAASIGYDVFKAWFEASGGQTKGTEGTTTGGSQPGRKSRKRRGAPTEKTR